VVSIATVKVSDMVLDSRVGALDRTLGFVFGLGRGLIIVVVAFLFFAWLVPPHARPTWVQNAKSRVVLEATGNWLRSLLPEHPEKDILEKLKRPGLDEQTPPASDQHSELRRPIYREDNLRIARAGLGAGALLPL
jgi:membrane protein required for colicin V production